MNYLRQYTTAVLSGEITACHKIKQVSELLLDKLDHPEKHKPYVFDEQLADRPISFIEKFCMQPKGKTGAPLKLELFQKAILQAAYGFVDTDARLRQYQEILEIIGRKNGKTTKLAANNLFMLIGDGEGAPEIYTVATKLDQAKLCFNSTHTMVKLSPLLAKRIKKRVSDLYYPKNMGFIKPLASNTNSLDGLDGHGATIDELSAIKNRDVYDLTKQSMAARRQPLLFCITTNGFVRGGIFDAQYDYAKGVLDGKIKDERFLPFIYELDDRDEWPDETKWIKANPGLGTIKKRDYLRSAVEKARNDETYLSTVLVKDFNLKENSASAWLNWSEVYHPLKFDFGTMGFKYGIGAFDMAETTDLTAAKLLCMRPDDPVIYVLSMYWLPEEVLIQTQKTGSQRGRDSVPYDLWEKQGFLRIVPGNKIDKRLVLEWFREVAEQYDICIPWVGFDPWHVDDSLLKEFKCEFGKNSMLPVRQGPYTLSAPMKELKGDMAADLIAYNNNPVDIWNLLNLHIKTDINGNIQPAKGLSVTQRIDGGVALIIGYVTLKNKLNDYQSLI